MLAKIPGLKAQLSTTGRGKNKETRGELYVYGSVVSDKWFDDDVSPTSVVEALSGMEVDNLDVYINSGGGSVFAGVAIHSVLSRQEAQVNVHIDGIAASVAGVIAMAGDHISMAENGMFMIHKPWSVAVGDANDMRKEADTLDSVQDAIVPAYARTSLSDAELESALEEETWYSAQEALAAGFIDEIAEPAKAAASVDLQVFGYKHAPDATPPVVKTETRKEPKMATNVDKKAPVEPQESVDTTAMREEIQAEIQAQIKARMAGVRQVFKPFQEEHGDLMNECLEDNDCTPAMAGEKLLAALAKGAEPLNGGGRIETVEDRGKLFIRAATEGMEMRAGVREMDHSNPYRGFGFHDMARACAAQEGQDVARMSTQDIIKAAIQTTSMFPLIYENALNKTLLDAFRTQPTVWRQLARPGDLKDFRPHGRFRAGTFKDLPVISEGDNPIGDTSMDDSSKESITASEHGYIVRITHKMMVDDDMGAFTNLARGMGQAAARSVENDFFTSLLSNVKAGPAMRSTNNLFDTANHGNLAASGAAISVASLSAAKAAMRKQQDVSGNDFIDIVPATILVPVELEDHARKVIYSESDIAESNASTANPIRNFVQVVSTPRLSGTDWYIFASPDANAAYEVGFLGGNQEPEVAMETAFDWRGVSYRIVYDYGIAPIEYRSVYRNPGA